MPTLTGIARIVRSKSQGMRDALAVARLQRSAQAWPCLKPVTMMVGCESSGTTPISHLLLSYTPGRFLYEGEQQWVWEMYQAVFRGQARVCDFCRLQLFDKVKVPGFAAILPEIAVEFPKARFIYILRDPRDVVASAFKTWRAASRDDLQRSPWIQETWLGISETDPIARLARRWSIYLERSARVEGLRFVRYEDFCSDKARFIMQLAADLNLPVNAQAVSRHCDEQASHQSVRGYLPGGPGAGKAGGLLSAADVSIIEDICGAQMRQWKYL